VNRLGHEASPYLRQHAGDPVEWFTWGDEALARAKRLDRPLFISIGYSSCHWCHVMGHESFADPATAQKMNEHFVSVKVDREERPDLDAIYMEAVQAATGRGGWPMSIFATAEGLPFLAGTYFPDRPRHGMPSFGQVLDAVSEAWDSRRQDVFAGAQALSQAVASRLGPPSADGEDADGSFDNEALAALSAAAAERLGAIFDPQHGGFGSAPKFPQPLLLDLLLREHERAGAARPLAIVERTLEAMASGGIYDHLGGGFSRYSVDEQWLVPHFEKMLYDQALLARVYLHAWQIDGDPRFLQVLSETIGYVLSELRDPGGGLYAAEDADSEGEEGRYYIWTSEELTAVLGETPAKAAADWYGVSPPGNFEGRNILHRARRGDLLRPEEIESARSELLAARAMRVRPGLDDKVIMEWNAMMCSTLAEAAGATGRAHWAEAAVQIASFVLEHLRRGDGRLLRSFCRGQAELPAYAADYAWLVDCCTRLGELTGDSKWTTEAVTVAHELLRLFADDKRGFLYTTGKDMETLLVRPRDAHDAVTPAAGSVAAIALARLGALVEDDELTAAAQLIVRAAAPEIVAMPSAFPELLAAVDLLEQGPVEIVVTGERDDMVQAVRRCFLPRAVLAWNSGPLVAGRDLELGYVCRRGSCLAPVARVEDLLSAVREAVKQS
jgi:uncharacterized protein YyaL (SSP411 family)